MTSKPPPASHQRPSTTSVPIVKPQCKIHHSALVADKAQITGSYMVEIGENVVIHPYARIRAENGNVKIGNGSLIAERAVVGAGEGSLGESAADVVVGEGVSIESSAVVEASEVGDHSTIEIKSIIGRGAILGRWCKVAPLCEVREREVLEDYTVIFGDGQGQRRVDKVVRDNKEVRAAKVKGREMEMEVLRGLLVDGKVKWIGIG